MLTGRLLHFVLLLSLLLTLCLLAVSQCRAAEPGPPTWYVFGPAPPKIATPLPPNEMVEPPAADPTSLPELTDPVYTLGELDLDIPIAPLTDGDPIEPLPPVLVRLMTRNCWHVRDRHYHQRVTCGDPY